jgi:hypothetical protein
MLAFILEIEWLKVWILVRALFLEAIFYLKRRTPFLRLPVQKTKGGGVHFNRKKKKLKLFLDRV